MPFWSGDEAFQFFSRDQTGGLAADADALRDRKGRHRMIAGDHDGVDPGGIAVPDRLPDSFADRVLERQQSCELEARVRFSAGSRRDIDLAGRDRDHLVRPFGEPRDLVKPGGPLGVVQGGHREDDLRGPFGDDEQSPVVRSVRSPSHACGPR